MQGRTGEGTANPSITSIKKHGRGFVMKWEAFANCKAKDLHRVKRRFNKTGYHSKQYNHSIQSGTRLVGQLFVFLQNDDTQKILKTLPEAHQTPGGTTCLSTDVTSGAINRLKHH